jgi:hypothetical protein
MCIFVFSSRILFSCQWSPFASQKYFFKATKDLNGSDSSAFGELSVLLLLSLEAFFSVEVPSSSLLNTDSLT